MHYPFLFPSLWVFCEFHDYITESWQPGVGVMGDVLDKMPGEIQFLEAVWIWNSRKKKEHQQFQNDLMNLDFQRQCEFQTILASISDAFLSTCSYWNIVIYVKLKCACPISLLCLDIPQGWPRDEQCTIYCEVCLSLLWEGSVEQAEGHQWKAHFFHIMLISSDSHAHRWISISTDIYRGPKLPFWWFFSQGALVLQSYFTEAFRFNQMTWILCHTPNPLPDPTNPQSWGPEHSITELNPQSWHQY